MTGHRIIKNLTKRGNSILGVGVYSAALAAVNGTDAIKIGTNIDDPWIDFKHLVLSKFPNNKHLPCIKSFYIDYNSEFYVCVMERLSPVTLEAPVRKVMDACKEYIEGFHSDLDFVKIVCNHRSVVPAPYDLLQVLKTIKNYTTHPSADYDEDSDIDYEGRKLDLHADNFMLRDGVLVINDPWSNVDMSDVPDLSDDLTRSNIY